MSHSVLSPCRTATLLALVITLSSAAGQPAAAGVAELVRSDGGVTVVRFDVGGPTVETTADGVRVTIEGFAPTEGAAGTPELPSHTVLVAVPSGSRVTHRVTVAGTVEMPGVRPRPIAGPQRASRAATPTLARVEDADAYARRFPTAHVDVSEPGRLRDVDVVAVTVFPAVYDPVLDGLRVASGIEVEIVASGGATGRAPTVQPSLDGDQGLYGAALINRDQVENLVAPPEAQPSSRRRGGGASFANAATWVKVFVDGRGMTVVTGAELASAGAQIAAIDPTSIRVFWGGGLEPPLEQSARSAAAPSFMNECAIRVVDGGQTGALDSNDQIIFFGQTPSGYLDDFTGDGYSLEHIQHQSALEGVYWLAWGGSFTSAPRRLETFDGTPAGGAPTVSTGRARLHFERDAVYVADLQEEGQKWEKWWFATTLVDSDPAVQIPIVTSKAVVGAFGTVSARVWGFTAMGTFSGAKDHYLRAAWNGAVISTPAGADTFIWDGPRNGGARSGRQDIVTDRPFQVQNTLTLETLSVIDPGQPERIDQSLLAYYDVLFVRHLDMAGENRIEFASPIGPEGTVNYEITGAPDGAVVYEVTDPFVPREVAGTRSGSTIRFAAELSASQSRKYWVGSEAVFRSSARQEIDASFPDLRNPSNRTRYLVIAHDSMIEPGRRLAAAHSTLPGESTPAMAMTVRVSDVYDEFGWGLKSNVAIRNFIDYAAHTWDPSGRPLYVCLLGDASYDPRDIFGGGGTETDLVPSRAFWNFIGSNFGGSDYLSDDFYVLTFGDDPESQPDPFMDLLVGRLPARTIDEALVLVDEKLIPFLNAPEPGEWRQRILLSADDDLAQDTVEGFRHVDNSETVAALLPPELELSKVYLHDYPRDALGAKPEGRAAFIEKFSAGAAAVNYIGHGAPDIMAHEAMFRVENTGQLSNGARLPLFFTFSCTVNRFDVPNFEGIGESLVKEADGGSISSVGATDLSFISFNQQLNELSFAALFEDGDFTRPRSLGVALATAKNIVVSSSLSNARKYVLLGDPAVVMPTPGQRLAFELAEVEVPVQGDTLVAGHLYRLTGRLADGPAPLQGEASIRVFDSKEVRFRSGATAGFTVQSADVFRSRVGVSGERFETAFVVPIDASQSMTTARDLGEIRAYVTGEVDGLGFLPSFLNVVDAPQEEPAPVAGPVIEASFDGGATTVPADALLRITVSDPSGINIVGNTPSNALFVRFDEEVTVVMNDLFQYDAGSPSMGRIDLPLPELTPGPHVARVFASDNFLNRSQLDLEFQVSAVADVGLDRASLYPNPFRPDSGGTVLGFQIQNPATVTVRVWTISGRLVRETFRELDGELLPGDHQVIWDGRDEDGDFAANGVYLMKIKARTAAGEETEQLLRSVVSR